MRIDARGYDQDYRLTSLTDPNILSWTLGHKADDDITAITDALNSADSQTFNYDSLNRLTNAQGSYGSLGYSYDADGNRLQQTLNGTNTAYGYATASNQLLSVGSASDQYDAAGNLLSDSIHGYSYNNAGRFTGYDANLNVYLYNALGQRSEKTVNGVITVFVYDEAGHLLGEYTPSGTLIAEHIWLNNRPIAVITPVSFYYVITDLLGTPHARRAPRIA